MSDRPDPSPPVPEGAGGRHPLLGTRPSHFSGQPVVENGRGLVMPRLGLGTWQLDDDEARRMVASALELGVRHIDTAQRYGNEAGVGRAIAESGLDRAELFVTTKIDNDHHAPDALARSMDESLERLGIDHADLVLVHWPVGWDTIGATLAALAQVQAAGRCLHIGVSNFTVDQLDQVADLAPLEVLQVECHPYLQQARLRRWCREHDWLFTAYSPLAQGAVADDDLLTRIGSDLDAEPSQVALAWLLQLEGVATIPRTNDLAHLEENWAARDLTLRAEDLGVIADLDEGRRLVDPDFAPW